MLASWYLELRSKVETLRLKLCRLLADSHCMLLAEHTSLALDGTSLRIVRGTPVLLIDEPADPGHVRWTTYAHATSVRLTGRDPVDTVQAPAGLALLVWGQKGKRRAVLVRKAFASAYIAA
jgi:hypothetical protein